MNDTKCSGSCGINGRDGGGGNGSCGRNIIVFIVRLGAFQRIVKFWRRRLRLRSRPRWFYRLWFSGRPRLPGLDEPCTVSIYPLIHYDCPSGSVFRSHAVTHISQVLLTLIMCCAWEVTASNSDTSVALLPERDYVTFRNLSAMFVHPTRGLKLSAIFLRHFAP